MSFPDRILVVKKKKKKIRNANVFLFVFSFSFFLFSLLSPPLPLPLSFFPSDRVSLCAAGCPQTHRICMSLPPECWIKGIRYHCQGEILIFKRCKRFLLLRCSVIRTMQLKKLRPCDPGSCHLNAEPYSETTCRSQLLRSMSTWSGEGPEGKLPRTETILYFWVQSLSIARLVSVCSNLPALTSWILGL